MTEQAVRLAVPPSPVGAPARGQFDANPGIAMTEHAVTFAAGNSLVGVLTKAELEGNPLRPAVVLLNAGIVHRVGPNRLHVRIARELARRGFASLRFDLSGIGDSLPRTDGLSLHAAALADVREAMDFVAAELKASSFILVGLCSGADLAFRAAMADGRVVGAVLIDGMPYHTLRSKLRHLASRLARLWRSGICRRLAARDGPILRHLPGSRRPAGPAVPPRMRDVPPLDQAQSDLRHLIERGVRLLLLYTSDRDYSYPRHFQETFPGVRSDRVDVAYFPDADHTFTLLANQDLLVRSIDRWMTWFR
jgi:alpha-beta hydrolase superfamily lysophospholipase